MHHREKGHFSLMKPSLSEQNKTDPLSYNADCVNIKVFKAWILHWLQHFNQQVCLHAVDSLNKAMFESLDWFILEEVQQISVSHFKSIKAHKKTHMLSVSLSSDIFSGLDCHRWAEFVFWSLMRWRNTREDKENNRDSVDAVGRSHMKFTQ